MKKTVKIVIAAVFAVGFGSFANAQSASISVDATVISEIAVNSVSNLNFGTIVVGQKKLVFSGNRISTKVSTGAVLDNGNGGEFTVAAQAGADVTVSLVLPANLTGTGGSLPIVFGETVDFEGSSFLSSEIKTIEQNATSDIEPNSPSIRYANFPAFDIGGGINGIRVLIGGEVDATGATAGTYTGTITLNATYN